MKCQPLIILEKGLALDSLRFKTDDDIHDAEYVLYYAELLVHVNIKLPSRDKILSISDRDAAYTIKSQRNPVIGYKPFITLLKISAGTADILKFN